MKTNIQGWHRTNLFCFGQTDAPESSEQGEHLSVVRKDKLKGSERFVKCLSIGPRAINCSVNVLVSRT
jgi:hypothetical protein